MRFIFSLPSCLADEFLQTLPVYRHSTSLIVLSLCGESTLPSSILTKHPNSLQIPTTQHARSYRYAPHLYRLRSDGATGGVSRALLRCTSGSARIGVSTQIFTLCPCSLTYSTATTEALTISTKVSEDRSCRSMPAQFSVSSSQSSSASRC